MIKLARSGYLPDVSSVFGSWRDTYKKAMSSGNWDLAALSLHNMNGALDVDYQLPISNEIWEEKKESCIVWKCNNCTTTETKIINKGKEDEYKKEVQVPTCSKYEDIRTYDEQCSLELQILSGQKTRHMWVCPKCTESSSVEKTEKEMQKYPSPHYRGCIYEQPAKPKLGLMQRRGTYPAQMEAWCTNYSMELEHQLANYRLEYVAEHGHDMEDSGFKDDGD